MKVRIEGYSITDVPMIERIQIEPVTPQQAVITVEMDNAIRFTMNSIMAADWADAFAKAADLARGMEDRMGDG